MNPDFPRYGWQLRRLARSSSTPFATLAVLAHHDDVRVRALVARNPSTPTASLAALIHDSDPLVRAQALLSPSLAALRAAVDGVQQTPSEQLYGVTNFFGQRVRYDKGGPRQPLTAPQALAALHTDGGVTVIKDLDVLCPETEAAAVLANSRSPKVRSAVLAAGIADSSTLDFLARIDSELRFHIAAGLGGKVPSLTTLLELADEHPYMLSRNSSAPAEILSKLAHHYDWSIRQNVASNPNTTAEDLGELANDHSLKVCEAVANNDTTPPRVLASLARRFSAETATKFGTPSPGCPVKYAIAKNPKTPVSTLRMLAEAGYRREVAANPTSPADLLADIAAFVISGTWEPTEWEEQIFQPDRWSIRVYYQDTVVALSKHQNAPARTISAIEHWRDSGALLKWYNH